MTFSHKIRSLLHYLLTLKRSQKVALQLFLDGTFLFVGFGFALLLRVGADIIHLSPRMWVAALVATLISLFFIKQLGLYRALIRYISFVYLFRLAAVLLVPSLLLYALGPLLGVEMPNTLPIIYFLVCLVMIFSIRVIVGYLLTSHGTQNNISVAIYGANENGRQMLNAIFQHSGYIPRVLIDTDKTLIGTQILGINVHHPKDLQALTNKYALKELLLTEDLKLEPDRDQLMATLYECPLQIKSVPSITDILSGRTRIDDLENIDIAELLKRETVAPDPKLMQEHVAGKSVLVTGAGGSIGSEICRQIIALNPKHVILLDISEPQLYEIDRQLRQEAAPHGTEIIMTPILGSIQDEGLIKDLLTRFAIDTIYHAAAYKHVPLLEYNMLEGVRNNVVGTHVLATAATRHGVDQLILVSTDKAVRPTNFMGASKRVAELICQSFAQQGAKTKFLIVRFGNVMGSSGSIIPLFRKQLKKGGPLTVTHKDVTRYFMTIKEASQLVIQGGAISDNGDLLILDMGEPVKVLDLAKRMAQLSGLTPVLEPDPTVPLNRNEIAIEIIGLRPGEKLYEELTIDNRTRKSLHPKIFVEDTSPIPTEILTELISNLLQAIADKDVKAITTILMSKEIAYHPSDTISELVFQTNHHEADAGG